MKSKAKNLLVKLTSLVLAVFLVLPSQVWAADLLRKDSRKYTANSSIMGLATQTSPDDSKESLAEEADRQTLLKANQATDEIDAYTIEKSATLSKTTKEITYQYIIKSKTPSIESEKKENIYAIFALNNNTDLTDIKVDKVTTLDESGKEIKATYQVENPGIFANDTNISTLGIRSEKQANDLLYYLSAKVDDEAIAKIEEGDYSPIFALDMVLANNDKKAIYENRYALEVNKYTEEAKSDERLLEIKEEEKLEEVEENKSLIKGEYSPESNGLFATNPATVTWTDYILSTDDKEFVYDIDLDEAQETENSEISVEFYESKENGFILNNSFTQKLPFANSIKLQIPRGQLARITLTTTINKEANAKEFTYNGKILANPDHKEEEVKEESKTEEKADDDPDPLPEQKEESADKSKDKEKAESDKTEITLEADPETNEVLVDPDLIKEEKADKNEEEQDYSAIDLNRDSVIRKFQEEENTDPIMEIAINNIASLFNDYNKEAISYDKLLASLKEQSKDIDKEDFRAIATGLLAGINKDNYKVANIEIDNLLDDIYGKETITEIKEDEKAVEDPSIENNSDDNIPTQTIDQNLDLDSLDTENEADALSPEEKDKQKALESFDKALDQVKEESKKPQDDDRTLFGNISEGVKGIFGQSNLQKADSELKAALDEGKSLEEIQALLLTLGEKYELNRKDEAKLMADNEDAIKALIQRDADKNFKPNILMAQNADGISPLTNKKFTVRTIFETSTINGPVKKDQYFDIILDDKLTVKDPSTLEDITYNGNVIATPTYDAGANKIRYQLTQDINENLSIPLSIDVDYNTAKITPGEGFTVTNKVQGLGVKAPKDLVPQRIDKNGNPAGSIIEPGRDDVTKIIDDEKADYNFDMDVIGTPVVNGAELKGMNWTITVDSDKDLFNDLGFKLNLTTVIGSGLGEIQKAKLDGENISLEDQLDKEPGLVDSKHHALAKSTNRLTYSFYTPVTDIQSTYMLDVSVYLQNKEKRGALRALVEEGYPQERLEDKTPNRVGMNNRTTILGEFKSESTAKWTVSDGVTSADTKSDNTVMGLPWESRKLTDNQSLTNASRYVYGISKIDGKMVKKLSHDTSLNAIPAKQTNPKGQQSTGNIAIYEFDTSLNTENQADRYGLAGVEISKYKDISVDQNWGLPEKYNKNLPEQTLTVKDNNGTQLGQTTVEESTGKQRTIIIPDVRLWQIDNTGNATMIDHKIEQTFPDSESFNGNNYKYSENGSYYDIVTRSHHIDNSLTIIDDRKPADFTVLKVDTKGNPLPGAKFYLLGAEVEVITDANGEATFRNISPGNYTLKETKAPDGYKLDQTDKTVTISDKGEISVSGTNAQLSNGTGKTDIIEHSDYPNWPDFMNTQHYGKIDEDGNLNFYVYLKPYAPRFGGSTDKDTTFNISLPGVDLDDTNITVYDVNPGQRQEIFNAMNDQSVDQKLSALGQIKLGEANNNGSITGNANARNPLSLDTCYQLGFPSGRFGTDWGFLVKVSAKIDNDRTILSYDWLAKDDPKGQSKIRQNVNISKNSAESGIPSIIITNEAFKKSEIEVAKFADTKNADGNKERLGGAEFVLKNENGQVIGRKFTDDKGKASFGEHPEGKYYLEEVRAPEGYEKSDVYFIVTVDEKGQVSYTARFKNSQGTPTIGVDYYIEKQQAGDDQVLVSVDSVNQKMYIADNAKDSLQHNGIWDAYRLESLNYDLKANLSNVSPGKRFEIQFDPNLDFTQYFKEFPDLYHDGVKIAEPYFDYKTNLLTYVFNENSKSYAQTTIELHLIGMIPSKFYAINSGRWPVTTKVAPNQEKTIQGNRNFELIVPTDYSYYDEHKTKGKFPSQAYYFRDVYKADDGNWYVTAIGYYNPVGNTKFHENNKIWFNWKFTNWQGTGYNTWKGMGYEAPYFLEDVKVYKTSFPGKIEKEKIETLSIGDWYGYYNKNMPLSMGIRPEQDPSTYERVFSSKIDPNKPYSVSQGTITLNYDPSKITEYGDLHDKYNAPLTLSMPGISNAQEGYVIEQTFKIRDIKEFNTHWRAFYMGNGESGTDEKNRELSLNSFFVTGPNDNIAKADQTGVDLPSYAKEEVGIINKKYTPASFKLTKVNQANQSEKLAGASFALTDSTGRTIYRTSNTDGVVTFKDLAPGKYTLKEFKAPEGYIKSTKEWNVTVYSDGNVKITSTSIIGGGEEYTGKDTINIPVTNKPAGKEFKVYKKDADGKPLAGAKFKITDPDGTDPNFPLEAESDANGVVSFTGQPQEDKDYVLEEVEPPTGYKKLDKKWVIRIEDGKTKIYTYSKGQTTEIKSILGEEGTYWVNVKERPTTGWTSYDNRLTGWAANSQDARYLGSRIVAINKGKNYVIQRYVINPEARKIGQTSASIHRQSPYDPNMDWFDENNFDKNNDIKIFTLDKAVSGFISDIRLANYNITDISSDVKKEKEAGKYSQPDRLKLTLPETNKPIVVDIKVKYQSELGGVGTGMDWSEASSTYGKTDYYERVTDIVLGDSTKREAGSIIGSYVAEGSLDVTNELQTYGFKIKKVKENDKNKTIQGAVFKLTGPDDSQDERYMTSGKDGMILFEGLKPGIYTLEETEPAPGYEKTDEKWTVTITSEGKAYIKPNSETSNKASLRKAKAYAANDANSDLEIGDSLVDTENPQGAGIREQKNDYEILQDKIQNKKQFATKKIEVTTNAEYLGDNEFLVRVDMHNYTQTDLANKQFSLHFNNDATFVEGSTRTWKWKTDGEDGDPSNSENKSRWHSGYNSNTKIVGLRDNELTIGADDTASIEFKVKVRSNLGNNGQVNLFDYVKFDNQYLTPYPRVKKIELYGINYDAEGGTIKTEPMDWATNGPLVEIIEVSPKAGYTKISGPIVTNNTTGKNIPVRNDNKFPMPNSHVTISAKFEANSYKVKKGKIENGSLNVPASAKTDQVVNITDIKPSDGYKLGEITVTDANGNPVKVTNNSFKMPAGDVTVNATFKKLDYNITKEDTVNGTFTVPETAEAGSTVTITLNPNEGYEKDTISVKSGDEPIQVNGNTFTMPASDVVVEVTFKPIPPKVFNITVDQTTNGSVSSNKESAKENEEVILTVKANEGYELDKLFVNGKPVEVTNGTYKLTMPKEDVKVSATFRKKPITPPEGSTPIPDTGYEIANKQTGLEFKLTKESLEDAPLANAEFSLVKYTNGDYTEIDNKFGQNGKVRASSDKDGKVSFTDESGNPISLPIGFYRLTEEISPSGYKKAQAPWDIEVYEDSDGQLKARYKGPELTPDKYIENNQSYENTEIQTADNGIKYKTKLTYINTESKTYVQRIYIDTRGYTGQSDKVNIQITPKHKRDEIDFVPGPDGSKPPETIKEGVKTAYRSTYKITGAPTTNNEDAFANEVLNRYDLSKNNVTMLNTARWRPFDWGFDEDIMNLDAGSDKGGVYFIDVEGFYDDAIITGIDSKQDNKNTIPEEDLQKLELNFDFYDGARSFQQRVNKDGQLAWTDGKDLSDSYLGGNIALGYVTEVDGKTTPTASGLEKAPGAKYQNWLSKKGGRIDPPLDENNRIRVESSIDLGPLYSSDHTNDIPEYGMIVKDEDEVYNITFSKHGRDNQKDPIEGEKVTNNRLEGAIFKLQEQVGTSWEDTNTVVGSAFNGYFGFRGLKPGRYRLMEVKAPEGYKPITEPLLHFTIKTVKTNTGEVVDPETGDIVNIKNVNIRFTSGGTIYNMSELNMVDPKDDTKTIKIEDAKAEDLDIEKAQIINPVSKDKVPLNKLIVVGEKKIVEGETKITEYPVSQIKIVPGSSGYISLEYDNANGVYQYLPEGKNSPEDGKLIDFVTSATAKNMGKIINEKPGEGSVTIQKMDNNKELLPGAKFRLTRISNVENTDGESTEKEKYIYTGTVGEDGKLEFTGLPIGNYRLVETESPEGYINTDQVWYFTVGGEGLDPYAGPIERTGIDLSDKITLNTTKMTVINPDKKTNKESDEIHPHWGESMEFTNKFTLDKDVKINPGDYFTLKMSDQIDLNGIFVEYEITNLDIIADGVGTIAKADYDRKNRTITYTFTDYAKTYTLIEFENKLTAFIDLLKVKNSDGMVGKQEVGFGIGEDKSQYKDIKVVYDLVYGWKEDNNGNAINLASKIVEYNPSTGEFLQYYYINRLGWDSAGPIEFRYFADQNLENVNVSVSEVDGDVNQAMPESYGVDESSQNLSNFRTLRSYRELQQGYYADLKFNNGIGNNNSYVVKVTGKVAGSDKSDYTSYGYMYKYYNDYCNCAPMYADVFNGIRYFKNESAAKVNMNITAINPENKIVFKKVDQDDNVLPGAKFKLQYKAKKDDTKWTDVKEEVSDDKGLVTFTKLKKGFYQLIETKAPDGYKKASNPVVEFEVDRNGRIIRQQEAPTSPGVNPPVGAPDEEHQNNEEYGIIPIPVVNNKVQEITFKKVDETDKRALEGAEFEVLYKPGKDGEYAKDELKLYEKTNADGSLDRLVLKAGEEAPKDYKEVKVFTTDKDGLVKFKFYENGYYAIKEIKAPKGYSNPRGIVREFALIDGKVQEEKYKTEMQVSKTKSWFYANGMHDVYNTDITMNINPDHEKITYEKDKSKITLSGLPLNSEFYENNISSKTGITISAKLVNKDKQNSSTKTYTVPLSQYGTDSKGNITIDLYELVKELEKKTDDPITSENTIELSMSSTLALATELDIKSKIEIGEGEDKISEDRSFHIGTKGDEKVNHSFTFTQFEQIEKDKEGNIEISNKKATFPLTGGNGVFIGFAIIGTAVMLAAIAYFGIFQNDKNRRRSARYKK